VAKHSEEEMISRAASGGPLKMLKRKVDEEKDKAAAKK